MTVQSASAGPGAAVQPSPGQVVGGRFQVEGLASQDALGVVLSAKDTKTGKPISLRVLGPQVLRGPDAEKTLKSECREAAALSHRSIAKTYGVGSAGGGSFFVAGEWIEGSPLSDLVRRRREAGGRLSLRGAYNVVAHVCKALTHAHARTPHGALRPSVVWVTRSGRVKVSDFGVSRAVVRATGAAALGESEQACLAPEVKAGAEPDQRSDIFGIGALLYEMLTGRSPAEGFVPPSQAHPDATQEIDQVLLRCLAADPSARFESPDEVQRALLPLVEGAPEVPFEEDFGVEIDIDVDLASRPPAATAAARAPRPVPPPARAPALDAPRVGSRVSIHEEFRASHVGPAAPRPGASAPPPRASAVDLKDLLAKITENDAPRWMVVKDKLDHGPFSGRELVELILKGDVLGDHGLLNMDTGQRKKVAAFPEFTEFLEQFRIKRAQQDHEAALQRSEKVEKASNAAKFLVAAGVLAVLGIGVGIFLITRQVADDSAGAELDARADLFERGDIEITGTAGILPPPPRRQGGGGGRARGGGGGGGGGAGGSYEEAMNRAVNLGDATQGGGERQLTSSDVAGVMNRHINSLFGCVSQELRGGGNLGTVQIDLAIAGSGQVLGASVRQGSASFQSCISGRVRRVRFPTFPAPRMGARYSFAVD